MFKLICFSSYHTEVLTPEELDIIYPDVKIIMDMPKYMRCIVSCRFTGDSCINKCRKKFIEEVFEKFV